MNHIIIIGNLTADPETRDVGGKSVTSFTVAVNERRKGKEEAIFFRVSAWETLGETCKQYLAKGRKVAVSGRVSCHAYKGRDGEPMASLDVRAGDVEFLSPKESMQVVDDPDLPY